MSDSLQSRQRLISEVLILEKKWTGRSLERITTVVAREMVKALKDTDVQTHFAKEGWATIWFGKEDVPVVAELPIGELIMNVQEGDNIGVAGRFEYADESSADENAIVAMIRLPRDYDFSQFHLLVPDLKDALRHEIEHSFQSTEMLSGLSGVLDQYASMDSLSQYLLSDAETFAHVAGFYKKAKMLRIPASDVLDEELENLRNVAVDQGLPIDELNPLLKKVKKQWMANMKQRYPRMKTS